MFMVGTMHHCKDCKARREMLQEDDLRAEASSSGLFATTSASASAKGGLHASLSPTAPAATASFLDRNQQRWASDGSIPDGRVFEGGFAAGRTALASICHGNCLLFMQRHDRASSRGCQCCSLSRGWPTAVFSEQRLHQRSRARQGAGVRGLDAAIPVVELVTGVMPAVGGAPPSIGGVTEIVREAQPAVGGVMPVVGGAQSAFGGVMAGVGGARLAFGGVTGAVEGGRNWLGTQLAVGGGDAGWVGGRGGGGGDAGDTDSSSERNRRNTGTTAEADSKNASSTTEGILRALKAKKTGGTWRGGNLEGGGRTKKA
eukprot:jgi/Undpi1/14031/HiC_scaffold_9.g03682.m1